MKFKPGQSELIVAPLRAPVQRYANLIHGIAGPQIKGLTFFGAVVSGAFDLERHAARNVLVVDRVDLELLRKLASHGPSLGKERIAAPLVMTPDYVQASRDTFALELIEIQQKHATLFGEDYFADLTFEDRHVRLQCEREFKVSLMTLRHGLLTSAGREKLLEQTQWEVAEGLLRTLRGLLWLKGQREAHPAAEVLDAVQKLIDRKLDGLRASLDSKARQGPAVFDALYHEVETLKRIVDGW